MNDLLTKLESTDRTMVPLDSFTTDELKFLIPYAGRKGWIVRGVQTQGLTRAELLVKVREIGLALAQNEYERMKRTMKRKAEREPRIYV